MLITPPETVAPQKRANGLLCLSSRSTFQLTPHVIITWSCLPLNPKYAPLFRKTALIKASGLSENEI